MYRYGIEEGKNVFEFLEGDVIGMTLDRDNGVLEISNESREGVCARFFNVFGSLVFGVQMEGVGGMVEILE